jgi:hypothetical protein
MGFNRRKMEDQRREAAEKEAASRRSTDAQVLKDASPSNRVCDPGRARENGPKPARNGRGERVRMSCKLMGNADGIAVMAGVNCSF